MLRRSVILFVAFTAGSAPAVSADAPKPLRTITYDVEYSTQVVRDEQTSGFLQTTGSVSMGHGLIERRFSSQDSGRLTIEIVAATADGGLVADVAYNGQSNTQPRVRVAIFADGRLSANPAIPLSPEAARVLPFLARGLVAERDLSPGSTWTTDAIAPGVGTIAYRVTHADATVATIEFEASLTMKGSNAFVESERGSTAYETQTLAPIQLDVMTKTRRSVGTDQNETLDAHVVAHVVSDNFAKR